MKEDIYKNYTSTSVLTGVDFKKFTTWSHKYFKAFILPHIPKDNSCKILEIGCGFGRYTHMLTHELGFVNTIGLDISEEQIAFAKNNFGLTNVFKADAIEFLNADREKYDIILLMDVLEHLELEYAIQLLKKIKQALNINGKLIIQVPNGLSPLKPIFYSDVTHVRAFSTNSMTQILRMAGFQFIHHAAIPPLVHNVKSLFHRIAWVCLINPIVYLFVLLSHGNTVGGIFSSNLLTTAHLKE